MVAVAANASPWSFATGSSQPSLKRGIVGLEGKPWISNRVMFVRGGESRRNKGIDLSKVDVPAGKMSVGRMLEIHKALWLPVAAAMMYFFDNYSTRASLMTGFFGAYGVLWVIKSYTFWDSKMYNSPDAHYGLAGTLFNTVMVGNYFLYPYLAAKNTDPLKPVAAFAASFLFTVGGFLHYGADAQKFFTLQSRGSGLITVGFFSKIRHPSYLGEFLMWIALSVLAGVENPISWIPVAYLFLVTMIIGVPVKEKSLARYPEYEEWKENTGRILPKMF
eukprot:CAMPEP_0119012806 /NCGR_PEP_ID=MMETSP1176-20130426/7636_1 /TAXON_ID=265551 /ORGANISM="Synedropsis recta cf, Strain CCMP1620" /LENGTH=275 /DNA_ID=CAMNT_0006965835 /DNA_START=91 /DNA_END=918 /DNA_ORIENTATION=+